MTLTESYIDGHGRLPTKRIRRPGIRNRSGLCRCEKLEQKWGRVWRKEGIAIWTKIFGVDMRIKKDYDDMIQRNVYIFNEG
jgi:hypothetical protein